MTQQTVDFERENEAITARDYPLVIKYMGSKASITEFIAQGLNEVRQGLPLVDLFAGACAISGAFGDQYSVISNDIQSYSKVIASGYLYRAVNIDRFDIVGLATPIVERKLEELPQDLELDYPREVTLEHFNQIEANNQDLINYEFFDEFHLFTNCYSGTWWSAKQCVWIDSIRQVLQELFDGNEIEEADFNFGLTVLMHAMAYSSQGTGHYAQFRDAKTESSKNDINKYRQASVPDLFNKKFHSLLDWNLENVVEQEHELRAQDYRECLATIPPSVVYADPPYGFVHYSRFYHTIETIVKYDYPQLQEKGGVIVKGRYREDRHQSPFCIKTQVEKAFKELFDGIRGSQSDMVLSYSNTAMIEIEDLISLAQEELNGNYEVWAEDIDYEHKTMGRRADHSRNVKESIIIARRIV